MNYFEVYPHNIILIITYVRRLNYTMNNISLEDLSASIFHNYFLVYISREYPAYKDYNYKHLAYKYI